MSNMLCVERGVGRRLYSERPSWLPTQSALGRQSSSQSSLADDKSSSFADRMTHATAAATLKLHRQPCQPNPRPPRADRARKSSDTNDTDSTVRQQQQPPSQRQVSVTTTAQSNTAVQRAAASVRNASKLQTAQHTGRKSAPDHKTASKSTPVSGSATLTAKPRPAVNRKAVQPASANSPLTSRSNDEVTIAVHKPAVSSNQAKVATRATGSATVANTRGNNCECN